ncbi:MAG: transglutaminase-like domain-containing protein [Acidimicrobiia bacterium]|nr:transglutaminase-like domain-containing protein [Acidimicrobiia bacterium]
MRQQVFLGQVSAAGLLLTVSALFYGRVFGGPGWVGPIIGSVLLAGALSVALARTGMGRSFRALALGVVGVLFVVLAVILPATSFGGPGDIGSALYGSTIDGWRNALENTLPLDTDVAEPLGFVTVLGWLAGSLTGSLVTRSERSALPVVPPVLFAAVSLPLAAPNGVAAYLLIVALVGSAMLLALVRAVPQATLTGPAKDRVTEFVGERMLSERLIAGAPVLLALAFLAPLLALILPSADEPFDPRRLRSEEVQSASAINPLAQLKSQREASNRAFLLELPAPPSAAFFNRMGLVSLETYDGANWTTSSTYSATSTDIAPSIDVTVETIRVQQVVEILDDTAPWIPAAQPVSRIEADDVWYDEVSGSLLNRSDEENRTYTVVSRIAAPTNEQLLAAVVDRTDPRYTTPPLIEDSALNELVSQVEGTSDYERLLSLEELLRDNFTLVVEEPSGTALGRVEEFLVEGEGYRDQFVSAFAIAARLQAFPTRITVGYRIAEQNEDSTLVFLDTVTSEDYDAWPEVLFEGIGWVAFDPVPFVSGEAAADTDEATQIPEGTATASGPQPQRDDPEEDSELDEDDAGAGTTVRVLVASGLFLVVFPMMLLIMVAIAKLVRRRYRQNLDDPTERVLAGWQESKDRLLEAGVDIRPDMTIKEIVAVSRRQLGVHASSSLSALAPYVTTTIYSPDAPAPAAADAVWEEVDLFDRQLNETRSRTQNVKAKVDPRPLLERV